jgi:hypothetical protein
MKVKIIKNYIDLQGAINSFIKGKNIIDIKYCVDNGKYSALIIYEEKR